MTEEELIASVAAFSLEVNTNEKTVSKTDSTISSFNIQIENMELFIDSILEIFGDWKYRPIIILNEYKILKADLNETRQHLNDIQRKKSEATKVRNKALAALPGLRKQLQLMEHQLDILEPPRVVLEFKHRDKQRSS